MSLDPRQAPAITVIAGVFPRVNAGTEQNLQDADATHRNIS